MPNNLEEIINQIKDLKSLAKQSLDNCNSKQELEEIKIEYLGTKSKLTELQKLMANLPKEDKPQFGKIFNETKQYLNELYEQSKTVLTKKLIQEQINKEQIDITLPSKPIIQGSEHPLTITTREITEIFRAMGFEQLDSPEIETEYNNFTALNTPEGHPARDEQDTFYTNIKDNIVLRSQVSPFQARAMRNKSLPIRAISTGRVYRNEEINPRKLPFFHQLEILYIDKDINFGHLKWTLQTFFNQFFDGKVDMRLRPDFFPFTEPSAEVDAECSFCKGKGCSTCGHRGWLELLGCGMVDPNVLSMANIDPEQYSGFAAGLGIERFAMLKYGISDIRDFYAGDIRFLEQFTYS